MIQTYNLVKRYGSTSALLNFNLHVPEGSVFALLGPNGAGKTTALQIMLNILRATSGRVELLGCDSRKLGPKQLTRIGYIAENRELPGWMSVGSFLEYCRKFYPDWNDTEASNLIQLFELPLGRKLRSLSRGIRIKVAFVSALAHRPRLLILDEPFSGLDVAVREHLVKSVAGQTPNCTVLVATHDLSDIEGFATHIGYLSSGKLMFAEEMDTLGARFREIEVLLDTATQTTRLPEQLPRSWLNVNQSPGLIRFTHSQYDPYRCDTEVHQYWRNIRDVSVRPLSLRSIFIALSGQQT
jgi:ABC-2 type transport system ATP-binding protein